MYFIYFDFAFLGDESIAAAEAARCAQDQDKFWEYHDLLFQNAKDENAGDFKRENLDKFAQQLGLNMAQFGECVTTRKYKDYIQAEVQEGRRIGVSSTPTLLVNQRGVQGFVAYENEKTDRNLLVAPGVTLTDQAKLQTGKEVCLTGELDSNRRLSKGAVADPPGNDQSLCGVVKSFKPSTASQAGELVLETIVQGLKEIIEEELKKAP